MIHTWDRAAIRNQGVSTINSLIAKLPDNVRGVVYKVHQFVIDNREMFLVGILFYLWSPNLCTLTILTAGGMVAYEKLTGQSLFGVSTKKAIGSVEATWAAVAVAALGYFAEIAFFQKAALAFLAGQAIYNCKL